MTKLYDELAEWWPLLSRPSDYAAEAAFFADVLTESCVSPLRSLLELGSGGGNNASHLKVRYSLTLVDLSRGMLAVSSALNPECEHVEGDMRTVRLGRKFDAVLIHDAIMYLTTEADLRAAMLTAFEHCRDGGVALLVPDCVRETFVPVTTHGGHDDGERGLRYLEWTYDPDPSDTTFVTDFAILLRERNGEARVLYDRHIEGLFSRAEWLRSLRDTGFEPRIIVDQWQREVFVARRPS